MIFDGPIPGENLTSDPKNYPWHRPPDLVDYDDVVEYMIGKTMQPEVLNGLMSFLKVGVPISVLVSYGMLSNIGKGKFQIDMAILAAGPIARLMQILAEDAGIDYDLGIDEDFERMSSTMLKFAMGDSDELPDSNPLEEPVEQEEPTEGGLMGADSIPTEVASDEEQAAMLGLGNETDEEQEV